MIDVVIVNWNSGYRLEKVVRSVIVHNDGLISKIIIVDNASSDNSLDFYETDSLVASRVEVIRNNYNAGFGLACNQGAKIGQAKYILFLNPDAEVYTGTFRGVFNFLEHSENSDVGVCGVQLIDENGEVARSCARFPTVGMFFLMAFGLERLPVFAKFRHHMSDWDHMSDREVDHVIGAFYLIKRDLFDGLGGFDERFFVYLEDLDLSLRVRKSGKKIFYLSGSKAFHEGGGASRQVKAARLFYSLRSRLLYGLKHFSKLSAFGLLIVVLLLEPISRTIFALLRGGKGDLRNTLIGYGMLWRALPDIVRGKGR